MATVYTLSENLPVCSYSLILRFLVHFVLFDKIEVDGQYSLFVIAWKEVPWYFKCADDVHLNNFSTFSLKIY